MGGPQQVGKIEGAHKRRELLKIEVLCEILVMIKFRGAQSNGIFCDGGALYLCCPIL